MVCESSSADVDFCDSLLGHMQDCGINQNSLLILDDVVWVVFLAGPVIYSYASFLSVRLSHVPFFASWFSRDVHIISLQTAII